MECWSTVDGVVGEIMRIHRSLPVRPGIDEVEAAKSLIVNVEKDDEAKLESIAKQSKGKDVPDELFMILQEMQKNLVYFRSMEQKREALKLVDLENVHSLFDELIQRASDCVSNPNGATTTSGFRQITYSNGSASTVSTSLSKNLGSGSGSMGGFDKQVPSATVSSTLLHVDKEPSAKGSELFTRDDSYVSKTKATFYPNGYSIEANITSKPQILDSSLKSTTTAGNHSYMPLNIQRFNSVIHIIVCLGRAIFKVLNCGSNDNGR